MKIINYFVLFLTFLVLTLQSVTQADDTTSVQDKRLKRISQDIQTVVKRHYPDASYHLLNNKIHFEFNTRLFIIHVPLKTGEWQDPWEERGPKKGGILGNIELRDGQYVGAAVVPQTFDRRYYSILLLAPYSKKFDCYLYTHIYIPRLENKPEFIKEITDIINNFENRIEK